MNKSAKEYDELIVKAAPNYLTALNYAASLVPIETRHIASLGTGTGNLEHAVIEQRQRCTITGLEINKDHLDYAQIKLGDRFEGRVGDIECMDLPPSDCVISSLTLHHLKDRASLFQKINRTLPSRGIFINYDIVKAHDEDEHQRFVDYVTGFMRTNGLPDNFIKEETDLLNGIGPGADKPTTLDEQRQLLEKLGFHCDIHWQDHLFVVYTAQKQVKEHCRA